jgi:uncharacterized protein (TIGR02246 family)
VGGVTGQPEQPARPRTRDEEALLKRAEAFAAAFNKGDAAALAAFWATDADYVDQAGHSLKGRKAIEETYRKLFAANKGAKLLILIESARFVTPDVAIEDGRTEVLPGDGGPPRSAHYTAVHVKQEGKWLLSSVRETVAPPPSHHEHLQELEWLVGHWTDHADKGAAAQGEAGRASFAWADNRNFLVASMTTTLKDVPVAAQTQWIAWDPSAKRIRSWSFHSGGGFGEATWTRDGDRWLIKTTAILRDGKKLEASNIVTRVDADHLTWQSTRRTLDGQALPDLPEIKMKRVR